ncbi:LuxR C-terminal-related transcriptional regulator [Microvirga pudoricolor]|uniref:LuxR C-terminal-related transcriptional regulator n=1 Tax=Microvirga pudoricolor TaxID=2778729 RepID=UPI0019526BFE|nr:response regulator transcription factor [Microvirga pudoricolor]MBM6595172.1 response regulator transcription factor [Microvirga pudoricolor]
MPKGEAQVSTVLVCNNPMLREGLKHILTDTRFGICPEDSISGDAGQFQSADSAQLLFIVDANHDYGKPAERIRSLRIQYPAASVVVLANHFDMSDMMAALDAGAQGYCLSTIDCAVLVKSLELVMLGETVFPSALFLSNVASFQRGRDVVEAPVRAVRSAQSDRQARNLSSREAEILRCLMQGAPNKVIARELDVAEATVKVHVKAILRKIQVSNRTQAAIWATEHMSDEPSAVAR